jgi:hypothetical protein
MMTTRTGRPSASKKAAKAFLTLALTHVESASIRAWATTAHNGPLFLAEAQERLRVGRTDATTFATAIVCLAIGL